MSDNSFAPVRQRNDSGEGRAVAQHQCHRGRAWPANVMLLVLSQRVRELGDVTRRPAEIVEEVGAVVSGPMILTVLVAVSFQDRAAAGPPLSLAAVPVA